MTHWHFHHGDLLDIPADGLLCSANPSLNLSGGVGGAFALRYGRDMQEFLHEFLKTLNVRVVPPGSVVLADGFCSPFRRVAHAVAIDVFYDTSAELIVQTYHNAIDALGEAGCRTIAAACLGCGYGRCPEAEFVKAIAQLTALSFENVERVTLATTDGSLAEAVRAQINL